MTNPEEPPAAGRHPIPTFDPGNPLMAHAWNVPFNYAFSRVPCPDGIERLIVTVRMPSLTVILPFTPDGAREFHLTLGEQLGKVSGLFRPPGPGGLIVPGG